MFIKFILIFKSKIFFENKNDCQEFGLNWKQNRFK